MPQNPTDQLSPPSDFSRNIYGTLGMKPGSVLELNGSELNLYNADIHFVTNSKLGNLKIYSDESSIAYIKPFTPTDAVALTTSDGAKGLTVFSNGHLELNDDVRHNSNTEPTLAVHGGKCYLYNTTLQGDGPYGIINSGGKQFILTVNADGTFGPSAGNASIQINGNDITFFDGTSGRQTFGFIPTGNGCIHGAFQFYSESVGHAFCGWTGYTGNALISQVGAGGIDFGGGDLSTPSSGVNGFYTSGMQIIQVGDTTTIQWTNLPGVYELEACGIYDAGGHDLSIMVDGNQVANSTFNGAGGANTAYVKLIMYLDNTHHNIFVTSGNRGLLYKQGLFFSVKRLPGSYNQIQTVLNGSLQTPNPPFG